MKNCLGYWSLLVPLEGGHHPYFRSVSFWKEVAGVAARPCSAASAKLCVLCFSKRPPWKRPASMNHSPSCTTDAGLCQALGLLKTPSRSFIFGAVF